MIFIESSVAERIWFTTRGTFSFVHAKQSVATLVTEEVSTVCVEWLCESLGTYRAEVVNFCLIN